MVAGGIAFLIAYFVEPAVGVSGRRHHRPPAAAAPTSKRGPIALAVGLKKHARTVQWLVDSMIPEQAFSPVESGKQPNAVNVPNGKPPKGALSTLWVVVLGALLALIALVPILVLLNTWRRHRAIERRYQAERGL